MLELKNFFKGPVHLVGYGSWFTSIFHTAEPRYFGGIMPLERIVYSIKDIEKVLAEKENVDEYFSVNLCNKLWTKIEGKYYPLNEDGYIFYVDKL